MKANELLEREIYPQLLKAGYYFELFNEFKGDKGFRKDGQTNYKCYCPYCGGNDFSFATDRPVFRCFNCGEAGDWVKFLQDYHNLSFQDAFKQLADKAGVEIKMTEKQKAEYERRAKRHNVLKDALAIFQEAIKRPENEVYQYLREQRGYDVDDILRMGLGAYSVAYDELKALLEGKGHSTEAIEQVGLNVGGMGTSHKLVLPVNDAAGHLLGFSVRAIDPDIHPKYLNTRGLAKKDTLVGIDKVKGAVKQVTLVEGMIDALYLNAHGVATVALGGKDIHPEQIELLREKGIEEVTVFLDRGEDMATKNIGIKLASAGFRVYVVSLPSDSPYKDPEEMARDNLLEYSRLVIEGGRAFSTWLGEFIARHHGATERGIDRAIADGCKAIEILPSLLDKKRFKEALTEALGVSEDVFQSKVNEYQERVNQTKEKERVQALQQRLYRLIQEGDIQGATEAIKLGAKELEQATRPLTPEAYSFDDFRNELQATKQGLETGWDSLDRYIRIPQGAITILAGRPGHGKTTTMLNLLRNMLKRYPDKRFYFFSYEEARKYLVLKLIIMESGVVLDPHMNQGAYQRLITSGTLDEQPQIREAVERVREWLENGRLVIVQEPYKAEELASIIRDVAKKEEVGAIFADYIQKIGVQKPTGTRQVDIQRASESIREAAVEADVPVILGAQVRRPTTGQARKEIKPEDMRESGDIEQDANLILGIYNELAGEMDEMDNLSLIDGTKDTHIVFNVAKNRGGVVGSKVRMSFKGSVLRIEDPHDISTQEGKKKAVRMFD